MVSVRHGDGAVLLAVPRTEAVLAALRARRDDLGDVIEARQALEVRLAALAARRRTEADLAEIDAALDAMAEDRRAQVRSSQPPEGVTTAVTRWSCGSTGSASTSSSSKTRATSRAPGRTCRSARS